MQNPESSNSLPESTYKKLAGLTPSLCIVDDNDDNLFLYEWIFTRYLSAYAVHLFSDATFLQHYLNSAKPKPDLILLDLKMPRINGFEMLAELKRNKRWQHIPVVVFTNSDSRQDKEECYQAGANDFVQKAFSVNTIKAQLEKICQQWLSQKGMSI